MGVAIVGNEQKLTGWGASDCSRRIIASICRVLLPGAQHNSSTRKDLSAGESGRRGRLSHAGSILTTSCRLSTPLRISRTITVQCAISDTFSALLSTPFKMPQEKELPLEAATADPAPLGAVP